MSKYRSKKDALKSTPQQIRTQLSAQAAAILAEGIVLSSFKHRGLSGIEREEPVRRFLKTHLPGRFHVGQGAIASTTEMLAHQHDIIVADRDLCFMLLNTVSAQLLAIESVHVIVEVRSQISKLLDVATSMRNVRRLQPMVGLRQGADGSEMGSRCLPSRRLSCIRGQVARILRFNNSSEPTRSPQNLGVGWQSISSWCCPRNNEMILGVGI